MKLIKIGSNARDIKDGSCVAVGCFDGVHRGHASVISRCTEQAERDGLASVVWTLSEKGYNNIITTTEEKLSLLKGLSVDYIALCDIDEIRHFTCENFVGNVLIENLHCKKAFCGYNFSFGAGRSGNAQKLLELMNIAGRECFIEPCFKSENEECSSSRIRSYLSEGKIENAEKLLGHPYFINGEITHGNEIGSKIGFPTVNIAIADNRIRLPFGVYKVRAVIGESVYSAVANYGNKPTVNDDKKLVVLETHILHDIGRIYGENITVEFERFIRSERKFASLDELTKQIKLDIEEALKD